MRSPTSSYFSAEVILRYLIMMCLCMGFSHGLSQRSALVKDYPYVFLQTPNLLQLDKGWLHEGRPISLPFMFESLDHGTFTYEFDFCLSIKDSLFLYFEGIGWEAELELNGNYLGVQKKPFLPWKLAIHPDWVKPEGNQLILRLSKGDYFPLYPKGFLGIFRPVHLMNKEQIIHVEQQILPHVFSADTVARVAPRYRRSGYEFNEFDAAKILLPLMKRNIKHIYFPFEPDRKMRAFCAQLGFVEVKNISDDTFICPVNAYDYEPVGFSGYHRFWLDKKGHHTPFFGDIYPSHQIHSGIPPRSYKGLLILMILFPVLGLFLIRLLNPGFLYSQVELLLNPTLFIDAVMESSFGNFGFMVLLKFVRILNLSIFLALAIYYIQLENQWEWLNLLRNESLLSYIFYQGDGLPMIFGKSFLIITGWFLLKQLLLTFIGNVFAIKNLNLGIMSLDVTGAYPLVILLPILISLTLFTDVFLGSVMTGTLLVLLVIYFIRRIYVLYVGLDRMFMFSSGMKFLYICTFNICPYAIWF